MTTIKLSEMGREVKAFIESLPVGELIVVTRDEKPLVNLTVAAVRLADDHRARRAGSAKGTIIMAPDFDAPLEDFDEYTS